MDGGWRRLGASELVAPQELPAVTELMARRPGRPKTLVAFPAFEEWRKQHLPGLSDSKHLMLLARLYKEAQGPIPVYGTLEPLGSFRSWKYSGQYSRGFLEKVLFVANSIEQPAWQSLQILLAEVLGLPSSASTNTAAPIDPEVGSVEPGVSTDQTPLAEPPDQILEEAPGEPRGQTPVPLQAPTFDRESNLLRLFIRFPELLTSFWDGCDGWLPTQSYLRVDQLHYDYICAGVPWPLPALLIPRAVIHDHVATMLALEVAAHIFGSSWRAEAHQRRGLCILAMTFERSQLLTSLRGETGYDEAREVQFGLLEPSMEFFFQLEQLRARISRQLC